MKRWIFTFRVQPPEHTVMVRYGASVLDAWYSRVLSQWYWVQPGGTLEKIAEPQMIFVSEQYAREHVRTAPFPRSDKPTKIRRLKKPQQLQLL